MKKFSIFLSLFVASFFLLSSNVRAIEYTINITDDMFNKLSNIDNLINFLDSNCTGYSYSNSHLICKYYVFYFNTSIFENSYFAINQNGSYPSIFYQSNKLRIRQESRFYKISDDFTSLSDAILNTSYSNNEVYRLDNVATFLLIYSNFDISFYPIDNNTYTFLYNNNSYSIVNDGTDYFPTLYDLKEIFNAEIIPPVPPDNTPILTTFYTTVGSKVAWLGEQFTESYIYIAVIGVFILIFLIELIRRYLL